MRKLGITVRKTIDGFIAAYAITYGHELLHADGDFDPFEAHLGLRVIHPKTKEEIPWPRVGGDASRA